MRNQTFLKKAAFFCLLYALFLGCSYLYMDRLAGFPAPDTDYFTLEITALLISCCFVVLGKKYFSILVLPLFLLLGSLCIFPLSGKPLHFLSFMPFTGFSAGLWGLWAGILYLLSKTGPKKYLLFLPILSFPLVPLVLWSYYFIHDSWPIYTALLAIFQTNGREALEYGLSHFSIASVLLLVFICFYAGFTAEKLAISQENAGLKNFRILLSLIFLSSFYLLYVSRDNLLTDIYLQARDYQLTYTRFQEEMENRSRQIAEVLNAESSAPEGLYVLVIGESENRKHMSVYGYNRPTTPFLEKAAKDPHFILYSGAYSCHVQTVQVLSYALTAKNQYNEISLEKAPSIIECAKAAGYRTIWLSNQEKYSIYDTPTSVTASEADQEIWLNHNMGTDLKTEVYDGEIVNHIRDLKISSPALLIIHLMGSHRAYWERYPKNHAVFHGDNWLTDTYDNSILYTDKVLSDIYETVKIIPHFQSMIYFSDHSEGIDEGLDHNASIFTWDMTYIPLYMAFSDEYMKNSPDKMIALQNHKNHIFTNDLIFNLMLGLMEIKLSGYDEPSNDLTRPDYDNNPSRFRTLFGEKVITEK